MNAIFAQNKICADTVSSEMSYGLLPVADGRVFTGGKAASGGVLQYGEFL